MTYDPNDSNHPDNLARAREAKRISDYDAGFYGAGGGDSDAYFDGKAAAEAARQTYAATQSYDFSGSSSADTGKGALIMGALFVGGTMLYGGFVGWEENSKRNAEERQQEQHIASYETGARDPRFTLTFAAYQQLERRMRDDLVRIFAKGEVCQAEQNAGLTSTSQCYYKSAALYLNRFYPPQYRSSFNDILVPASTQGAQADAAYVTVYWKPFEYIPSYDAEFQIYSDTFTAIRPTLDELSVTFNFPAGMLDKCMELPPLPSGYVNPYGKDRDIYGVFKQRDDREYSCVRVATGITLHIKQSGYDL